MNRLRKLAEDKSNEIHSLEDYFNLYSREKIINAITDICIKLATSEDAINWYIKDCDDPSDRSYALSSIGDDDVYKYLDMNIDEVEGDLLKEYNITFVDNFNEDSLGSEILHLIDDSLYKKITACVIKFIDNYLMDKLKEKNPEFYHLDIDSHNIKIIEDSVGDKNKLTENIDFYNRDAAFIDIDGEILVSGANVSHAQLINGYLSKNEKEKLDDNWYRPDIEEVSTLTGAEKIAFGHICQRDVWIIDETTCTNMTTDEVVSDIKKSGEKYSKIYVNYADEVTRLAIRT
jgi:hypothetical protein